MMLLFSGCLICTILCIYSYVRFSYLLNKLDDEQFRKIWEADLYEDKKDNN